MVHACAVKFFWCFHCAYSSCAVKKFCKQQKTNVIMLSFASVIVEDQLLKMSCLYF